MEGLFQKHFVHELHRGPSKEPAPRVNATFRWIVSHAPGCPLHVPGDASEGEGDSHSGSSSSRASGQAEDEDDEDEEEEEAQRDEDDDEGWSTASSAGPSVPGGAEGAATRR